MNKIRLFSLFIIFICQSAANAQDCNCTQKFDFFKEKIKLNYSGYRDKVTTSNQSAFDQYTNIFQQQALNTNSDTACFRILLEWKKWFRDGHVQLSTNGGARDKPEQIRAQFADTERIDLSEAAAKAYFDQPNRLPIEGIWQNEEGNYKVAIVQKPTAYREYAAIILKADSIYWMPGQIKFDLQKTDNPNLFSSQYFMRDHSMNKDTALLESDKLRLNKIGNWYMVYPRVATKTKPEGIYKLSALDSSTLLLVIPTMNESVRKQLDQLIKENKALLSRTPNLVIDCRGNGGGSDITYRKVLPLLYTNRTKTYRAQVWATKDNADKYANLNKNKDYPWYIRAYGGYMKRRINRNLGEYIGRKGASNNRRHKTQKYPQRVAVLIDGRCGSSCESFVEEARQSKKVTLIGVNTAGVSDYGNLHSITFPCGNLIMSYPTTRSSAVEVGKGIDNVGFPPDVRLGKEHKDWVEFARVHLHQKN
jgi:Peptidase family S41